MKSEGLLSSLLTRLHLTTHEILDSESFSIDESDYTVDLFKDTRGKLFVNIHQTSEYKANTLDNIPVDDLTILIQKLQHFFAIMNVVDPTDAHHIDKNRGEKIVAFYYKNVPIERIATNLGISIELVKNELRLRDIPLVSMKPPINPKYRKNKWKKS